MTKGIRLRRLLLRGLNRDYGPTLIRKGRPTGLAIVAGEISTGKTTILEFIDYCLGAGKHPEHPELVEVSIRTALLELDLNGETCVIERACFPVAPSVTVHWSDISGLGEEHPKETKQVRPAGDPESLSSFLLGVLGLAGIQLKEAPTQVASDSDPLSFRDLMGIAFVDNDRLGSKRLLYEGDRMKALKLAQVVDVIFGVHENAATELSAAINAALSRHESIRHDVASIAAFLRNREVASEDEATARLEAIASEAADSAGALSSIDAELRSRTEVADELRQAYDGAVERRRLADATVRDRETLRERLQALNGQYAADVSRLEFSLEAGRLFDELQVKVCPVCHSPLAERPTITDGACSLCGTTLEESLAEIDVQRELGSTRKRLEELQTYIGTVADEITTARSDRDRALVGEAATRADLDGATASAIAPFIAQRDVLLARHQTLSEERAGLETGLRLRRGLSDRDAELVRLGREIDEMKARLAEVEKTRQSRADVIEALSTRFAAILGSFGLHKLESPLLDAHYVPHNRGLPYTELSSGARTLVAIAWSLAILELATERGDPHPGFLIIDGISKNLTPADAERDPELRPDIIERVYAHIKAWTAAAGLDAEVLLVDNRPPRSADANVVVRYSSDADRPPFGLIEDAIT